MDEYNESQKADLLLQLEEKSDVFRNPAVKKAFYDIDRIYFVDGDYKPEAYEDYPLPIGFDQTISQPTTVAYMLELLDAQKGDRVLDIGSGSGWTTALLGSMVGKDGKVIGLERIPELVIKGGDNISHYKKDFSIEIRQANGIGIPGEKFNRILCSASIDEKSAIVDTLLKQLAVGGILVASVGESIIQIKKISDTKNEYKEFPGFLFVPYIK
ncbi:MAG: methyltransferase domain-containing protein [Candidatus Paceibacterota bacterium]|jgi:protein-L-isoaspartate(D-aspartate) O-methyltransferase